MSFTVSSMWCIQTHCLCRYMKLNHSFCFLVLCIVYITFCFPTGGSKIMDQNVKSCALPEECGEASVNFGLSKTWINTQCCNSNLCNTQSVPDSSNTTPNGRHCFTCDGSTCDKTLACEGNEDHCVTGTVDAGGTTTTVKGCISELMCSASNSFPSRLLGTKVSCCKGNLCNSAVTASTGLLLVVVALVSLTLFS
uniref:UPAR/Ly6 domain-containing protein n=1 Tax=Oryzias latipes TaxID=8090 RepID=A0A3B3I2G3_ORYLA